MVREGQCTIYLQNYMYVHVQVYVALLKHAVYMYMFYMLVGINSNTCQYPGLYIEVLYVHVYLFGSSLE